MIVENLNFCWFWLSLPERKVFFPSQVSNLGGESVREGERRKIAAIHRRKKRPGRPAEALLKKGAIPPCTLRAWNLPVWRIRQSIYEAVGNFYSSDSGRKGIKSKKAEPLSEKIRRSPAAADLTAVFRLDIYGKTVSCISLKNPENPHKH